MARPRPVRTRGTLRVLDQRRGAAVRGSDVRPQPRGPAGGSAQHDCIALASFRRGVCRLLHDLLWGLVGRRAHRRGCVRGRPRQREEDLRLGGLGGVRAVRDGAAASVEPTARPLTVERVDASPRLTQPDACASSPHAGGDPSPSSAVQQAVRLETNDLWRLVDTTRRSPRCPWESRVGAMLPRKIRRFSGLPTRGRERNDDGPRAVVANLDERVVAEHTQRGRRIR